MKKTTDINPVIKQETVKKSLFGLISKEVTSKGTIRVKLNLKVLFSLLTILAITMWIGKSAALYYFFKEVREFEAVTVQDMLLFPFNRSALREAQGDYQIEQGIEAIESGEWRQALLLLRQGINRSPNNADGRIALSKIYSGWRNDLAIGLLEEGHKLGIDNPESIKLLLNLLYNEKEDLKILEIAEEFIANTEDDALLRFIHVKRIQAALATGQLELADQIFRDSGVKGSIDGLILGSDLLVKLGKDNEAIEVLQAVIKQFPDENLDPVFSVLFGILRKNEKWQMGRDFALKYALRKALDWEPRFVLIEFLEKSGETERRNQEIEALIKNYQEEENPMLMLAATCADLGLADVSNRIYSLALHNNFSMANFSLLLIEAYVNSKTPEVAIQLIDQIVEESPPWIERVESQFNIIRSLAYYQVNDADLGDLYLTYFIESRSTTLNQFISAAKTFSEKGHIKNSMRLYEEAYLREPNNEIVLANLVNAQVIAGNADQLSEKLTKLIDLRRPNYDIIRSIAKNLRSDRFIFTTNRDQLIKTFSDIAKEPELAQILLWKEG